MKKALIMLNVFAAISCIALGIKFLLLPTAGKLIFEESYKVSMFKCDTVMRDHLIAKNRFLYEKSDKSLKQLKAAELSLMSCHDYDKLRKKMQAWGVSDTQLSLIGLEAIEENSQDLMRHVEIHEIKY